MGIHDFSITMFFAPNPAADFNGNQPQCSERSSAQEALPDSLGTLRAAWPRERLSVEVMKGEIRAGENPSLSVQVRARDCYSAMQYASMSNIIFSGHFYVCLVCAHEPGALLAAAVGKASTIELTRTAHVHVVASTLTTSPLGVCTHGRCIIKTAWSGRC